jgi:hypothetical protein
MAQFSPEGHALESASWLRQARHFTVYLNDYDARQVDPYEQLARVPDLFARSWVEILRPALASATRCRLYDLRWLTHPGGHRDAQIRYPEETRERWRAMHFQTRGGGTEIDLGANGVLDDADFWWWLIGSGAKPVFVVPRAAVDLAALFARSFDPHCIGNLGASVPKAAIDFARRTTAGGDTVAFLPRRGSYRGTLTLFASPDDAPLLFGDAIASAMLSESFLFRIREMASARLSPS